MKVKLLKHILNLQLISINLDTQLLTFSIKNERKESTNIEKVKVWERI